jgi:hypothetical protein
MKIAKIKGLYFEIPDNRVWYSFFNSPYPGHKYGTAIDIYYQDKALFPFEEGKVVEIKKIKTPQYVSAKVDYLILIEVKEFFLKILHVKPNIKLGEMLYFGDDIGILIVSGFFRSWSDMHAHFELRDKLDKYRARGGFLINPIILKLVPTTLGNKFRIVERKKEYYWLEPINKGKKNLTPLTYQGNSIEGGLPYYNYGAIFEGEDNIQIFSKDIQLTEKLSTGNRLFKTRFNVFVNDQLIRGIGIYCNQNKIKMIGGDFREDEVVKIRLN